MLRLSLSERLPGKTRFLHLEHGSPINSALMILRKKRSCYEFPFDGIDDSGNNYECWQLKSPAENPESGLARKEREEC